MLLNKFCISPSKNKFCCCCYYIINVGCCLYLYILNNLQVSLANPLPLVVGFITVVAGFVRCHRRWFHSLSSPLASPSSLLSFAPSSSIVVVGERKDVDCLCRRSCRSNLVSVSQKKNVEKKDVQRNFRNEQGTFEMMHQVRGQIKIRAFIYKNN